MVVWLLAQPGMEDVRSINPVVGQTNDGFLNDIRARPIGAEHVVRALDSATRGPIAEGTVGAGTGTVAFGWKGGIGTSSREQPPNLGGWPIGFSEEDFKDGISRARNPDIARVLHELDIVRGGSGYERVRDTCQQGGYPIPDWHETGPVLRVRFAPHTEVAEHFAQMDIADTYPDTDDVSVNSGEALDRPLNQRQEAECARRGEARRRRRYRRPVRDFGADRAARHRRPAAPGADRVRRTP
jgi:hypothetical protein